MATINKMKETDILNWGKEHRDKELANVPDSYLLWMYNKADNVPERIREYIKDNLQAIKQNAQRAKLNNAR
jgi:uncharacterized protein (DUF3820 family)